MLEDVEKMKNKGLKMKITANEFDKKFDEGEDIFELMENPAKITLNDFQSQFLDKKVVNVEFSDNVYNKIKQKSELLKVSIDDFIKMVVAERVGII